MAHGISEVLGEESSVKMVHQKQQQQSVQQQQNVRKSVGVMGSRRIFAPAFKLKVLDSYRNDIDCRGNQRATARKYGIHRRQIQKWLQCEDNLRNSCAETGNSGAVSSTVIPSAGVSKPDGTVAEATGPAVTPAAPALNLSLARLHGDELATQQGPPPLHSHPPPQRSSPSSPQYGPQSTSTDTVLPLRITAVSYTEYSTNHEPQHPLRREIEDRIQVPEIHGYPELRVDQERSYYVLNSDGLRETDGTSAFTGARNEMKVYQTLTSYRSSHEHRYGGNEVETSMLHHSSNHRHHQRELQYGDADSSVDGKTYSLLLAPSMIKTERASPDSAATPGPYEATCSPVAPRGSLSPVSHQATSNGGGGGGNGSSSSSSTLTSVHFESPQTSASPCLHVHVHEHAHACSTTDSEKPIPCLHQQERESRDTGRVGKEEREEIPKEEVEDVEDVEDELGRAVVKEEVDLGEETTINEEGEEDVDGSSSVDYQRQPVDVLLDASGPVSPMHDQEGVYSTPSSPRGPGSSGRSSSSCSDSEMDPLDCTAGNQNATDLTRRRSFSLRFKLDVLDAFHRDVGVAGNQRATARKFGINRRQVQKWLGQETELRGEIALRGNSRQRLGPIQDSSASGESPVDLRTTNYVPALSHDRIKAEQERSPPPPQPLYCCDVGSSSSHQQAYYRQTVSVEPPSEIEQTRMCNLSCCVDSPTTTSTSSCYQESSLRGACYAETQGRVYCYSPMDYPEISAPEGSELMSSPLKRQHCTLSCCYEAFSSPKRLCLDADEGMKSISCQESPPQETPLCLVKPKRICENSPSRLEPVTSTVPTPPASTAPLPPTPTSKKDAILFKPYLDNPVSKPSKEHIIQRALSPISSKNIINNNNNNCQSICNLNEDRGHDYALELSLRVPVSWRTHPSSYTDFPQVRSAFVRYPASPHYT